MAAVVVARQALDLVVAQLGRRAKGGHLARSALARSELARSVPDRLEMARLVPVRLVPVRLEQQLREEERLPQLFQQLWQSRLR